MKKENRNRHEEHSIRPQLIQTVITLFGMSLVALPEFWHFPGYCHSNFLFELCFQ